MLKARQSLVLAIGGRLTLIPAQTEITAHLNRGGWFATLFILVFAKVFVNPVFSTSAVQAVPNCPLYLRTGTSLVA